jgi:histidinol-phosphate/aromatic aminotransferase/cobyric acid decarboxylase-like protein
VFSNLLFDKNIYTRILNDKLDLDDTFLRIACGNKNDNKIVFDALKEIDKKL